MTSVDVSILEHLHEAEPDYAPLVASRLGVLPDFLDGRCEQLVQTGLVEPVSGEVVYRVTRRGERVLEAHRDATASDD